MTIYLSIVIHDILPRAYTISIARYRVTSIFYYHFIYFNTYIGILGTDEPLGPTRHPSYTSLLVSMDVYQLSK